MEKNLDSLFQANSNAFLFPKYLSEQEANRLTQICSTLGFDHHIFILSSGTTTKASEFKCYAISRDALFANAKAVNDFLGATSEDIWYSSLPEYHIGGLSIFARAYLSGSRVFNHNESWNPSKFIRNISETSTNYFSIVPTHLYDLVINNISCPKLVKGVFVGGDHLPVELNMKAHDLGYPVIETFGMTELCSQLASSYTKKHTDHFLKVLDIHTINSDQDIITVESDSVCDAELIIKADNTVIKNIFNGKLVINDRVEIKIIGLDTFLKPLGRKDSFIKIKGRLYDFLEIQEAIQNIFIELDIFNKAAVALEVDKRAGKTFVIYLLKELQELENQLNNALTKSIPPPLLPIKFFYLDTIPRTSLGKVKLSH